MLVFLTRSVVFQQFYVPEASRFLNLMLPVYTVPKLRYRLDAFLIYNINGQVLGMDQFNMAIFLRVNILESGLLYNSGSIGPNMADMLRF